MIQLKHALAIVVENGAVWNVVAENWPANVLGEPNISIVDLDAESGDHEAVIRYAGKFRKASVCRAQVDHYEDCEKDEALRPSELNTVLAVRERREGMLRELDAAIAAIEGMAASTYVASLPTDVQEWQRTTAASLRNVRAALQAEPVFMTPEQLEP